MSMSKTIQSVTANLSRFERVYAEARPRHRALAPYETIAAVLAALGRSSSATIEVRDAIAGALVTELQRSGGTLWSAMLLGAFIPMLSVLRGRLGPPRNEDLDQGVLLAFLEAARCIRSESYVIRNLRLVTEAKVYAERRAERRHAEAQEFDDDTYTRDRTAAESYAKVAADEVLDFIESRGGAELRDLVVATCAHDETVQEFVARRYPRATHAERASQCQRLRRAQANVLYKLGQRVTRRELERGVVSAA